MKIATNELEHLREEVKNCHRIIKDLQKKREFVGLTDEEVLNALKCLDSQTARLPQGFKLFAQSIESILKEKNT